MPHSMVQKHTNHHRDVLNFSFVSSAASTFFVSGGISIMIYAFIGVIFPLNPLNRYRKQQAWLLVNHTRTFPSLLMLRTVCTRDLGKCYLFLNLYHKRIQNTEVFWWKHDSIKQILNASRWALTLFKTNKFYTCPFEPKLVFHSCDARIASMYNLIKIR